MYFSVKNAHHTALYLYTQGIYSVLRTDKFSGFLTQPAIGIKAAK